MDQIFSAIQSLAAGNEETIKMIMAAAQNERRKIVLSCSPELSFQAAEGPGRWSALSLKKKRAPKLLTLLDVKKTELTAKEIIAGWLPKVKLKEPEAELPENVNYTCKSFADVMTLNSTMLQICQALRMLPRRGEDEVEKDLKTILENFELLQACLKELEELLLERDLYKMATKEEVNALQREVAAINAQIKRLAMATEAHNRKETQRLHSILGNSWSKKVPIFKESDAIFIEGTKGNEHEQFQFPSGVRLGPRTDGINHLYVADSANGRVLVMEASSGAFVAAFRLRADHSRLSFPIGLALDPSTDRLYVCDSHNHCVHVLDATRGTPILRLGSHGSGDANLIAPHGVAVDSSRQVVYVTDLGNNRIQVFDASNGAFVRSIHDSLDGWQGRKLSHPYGIALSSSGDVDVDVDDVNNHGKKLYVVNNGGHCVYVLEAFSGAFIRQFGSLGVGDGQFMSPTDVALDGHGRVYVADFGNNRVQAFSAGGGPHLVSFGSSLTVSPNGIALDADGNVYVVGFTNQILSYWQQQQQ